MAGWRNQSSMSQASVGPLPHLPAPPVPARHHGCRGGEKSSKPLLPKKERLRRGREKDKRRVQDLRTQLQALTSSSDDDETCSDDLKLEIRRLGHLLSVSVLRAAAIRAAQAAATAGALRLGSSADQAELLADHVRQAFVDLAPATITGSLPDGAEAVASAAYGLGNSVTIPGSEAVASAANDLGSSTCSGGVDDSQPHTYDIFDADDELWHSPLPACGIVAAAATTGCPANADAAAGIETKCDPYHPAPPTLDTGVGSSLTTLASSTLTLGSSRPSSSSSEVERSFNAGKNNGASYCEGCDVTLSDQQGGPVRELEQLVTVASANAIVADFNSQNLATLTASNVDSGGEALVSPTPGNALASTCSGEGHATKVVNAVAGEGTSRTTPGNSQSTDTLASRGSGVGHATKVVNAVAQLLADDQSQDLATQCGPLPLFPVATGGYPGGEALVSPTPGNTLASRCSGDGHATKVVNAVAGEGASKTTPGNSMSTDTLACRGSGDGHTTPVVNAVVQFLVDDKSQDLATQCGPLPLPSVAACDCPGGEAFVSPTTGSIGEGTSKTTPGMCMSTDTLASSGSGDGHTTPVVNAVAQVLAEDNSQVLATQCGPLPLPSVAARDHPGGEAVASPAPGNVCGHLPHAAVGGSQQEQSDYDECLAYVHKLETAYAFMREQANESEDAAHTMSGLLASCLQHLEGARTRLQQATTRLEDFSSNGR